MRYEVFDCTMAVRRHSVHQSTQKADVMAVRIMIIHTDYVLTAVLAAQRAAWTTSWPVIDRQRTRRSRFNLSAYTRDS